MSKENTSKSGAYHHGDLRSTLVSCARDLIEEKGPEGLSLRGVAQAAGVSRAAPYHHFEGKQALLAAVAAQGFRELATSMLSKVRDQDGARDQLDQLGWGYVAYAIDNPKLFRLMQGPVFQIEGVYPDLDIARQESSAPLLRVVEANLPGKNEAAIKRATAAAWAIVHGLATLSIDGRMEALISADDQGKAIKSVTQQLNLLGG